MIERRLKRTIVAATALALTGCFDAPDSVLAPDEGSGSGTDNGGTGGATDGVSTMPASDGATTLPPDDTADPDPSTTMDPDPTEDGDSTAADAHGSDSTGSESSGSGSTGEVDAAPTVVDIDPADAEISVLADRDVVITFSEPMDPTSVEGAVAWDVGGPAAALWSGDNTVLTLDFGSGLPYAMGSSPVGLDALVITVTIDTTATDVAGTALEAEFSSSFETARQVTVEIPHDTAYTGSVDSDGNLVTGSGDDPVVGDLNNNLGRRAFMGFSLGALPANILEITFAEVRADQWLASGDPIPALGASAAIHHIPAQALPGGAYSVASLQNLGVWTNEDSYSAENTKAKLVLDNVVFDYEAGASHSQFRLQFPTATNYNSAYDSCRYNDEVLEIVYLIP